MKVITLLMTHVLCNEMAAIQLMTFEESTTCSANFEQVKVALNPNVTWEEFLQLEQSERSEVSVASFRYYIDWKVTNPDTFKAMKEDARALVQHEL